MSKSSILALASLLAIAGAAPVAADEWWAAKGHQCWMACSGTPRVADEGSNTNYVCRARPPGWRDRLAGYNFKQSTKCFLTYPVGSRLVNAVVDDYECLCR
jgi:hypothetical protein